MLLERNALLKALEILRPEDYYYDNHRIIFTAIGELFEEDKACDIVTLAEKLRAKNQLETVGGLEYLALLTNLVPTAANVADFSVGKNFMKVCLLNVENFPP
jgi:replicative DNA helicase